MEDHNSQRNYYEILEVSVDSSAEEISQGYMRARNAYSQDSLALYSLMSTEECQNIVQLIDEAYSILSDPQKRRQYDEARGIVRQHSPSERQTSGYRESTSPSAQASHTINSTPETTNKNSMTKIVAQQKFGLSYNQDTEFEQEIEQSQEFSGALLKRIREYKNVDIVRLAEMTKISKTYLINIEEENFDALPAPVYVRGFVYQMAKCLKLNPDLVATSYLFRLKQARNLN
jgi:hypothetical protein